MKRRVALALVMALVAGCADAIRLSVAAGRVVCGALGCPCGATSSGAAAAVGGFDVRRDGTVQAVYAGEER